MGTFTVERDTAVTRPFRANLLIGLHAACSVPAISRF